MRRAKKKQRPKKSPQKIVTSFERAGVILGFSSAFMRQLRDAGADGFKSNGRIDCDLVHRWMRDNPTLVPKPNIWRDNLGTEKLRAEKRKNDVAEGLLIQRSVVAERLQRIFRPIVARIEQMLTNEYPAKIVGLDVPSARIYGKRVFDTILEAHREAALEWQT